MGGYRVELQPSAERDLDRLGPKLLARVSERIASLAEQPRPRGHLKLSGTDLYRIRVGRHRLVYDVDDDERAVYVVRVLHRRDIYRRLK